MQQGARAGSRSANLRFFEVLLNFPQARLFETIVIQRRDNTFNLVSAAFAKLGHGAAVQLIHLLKRGALRRQAGVVAGLLFG